MSDVIPFHDGADHEASIALDLQDRQDSLVGQIAADIARDISEGRLAPGADLNSVELAARFATSRTPVREALLLLEKEGLVEIPARRRPRVANISISEVAELYEIRAALNGLMIRSFLRAATDEELVEMETLFAAMTESARSDDLPAFLYARNRLHNFWVDKCGNSSLQRLLRSWKMRMSVSRLGGDARNDVDRILRDNGRLTLACHERDANLAEALIISMTKFGEQMILQQQSARAAVAKPRPALRKKNASPANRA
ncbi:GntR family transcriptional regulator [Sphingobium sp.]|uniref:GntR family transcriptional regulator n=1 Tax=Sphingobium sp. TaxID=1912891 RepID=UPI0028BD638B|nr:GntR family transcriptional regulator [Sphingobium sp.]